MKKTKQTKPKNRNYVHDSYTKRAFQEGYQARSVFKLNQIDQQHKLLFPGMRVLDLGAAPGSWSRYVLQRIQTAKDNYGSWLCAVDLVEINRKMQLSPAFSFFQVDFTCTEFQQQLLPYMKLNGLFDVILSDMAPKTTGNRTVDTSHSQALVEAIIAMLPQFLQHDGTLLFKLFQGGCEQQLQCELRQIFASCQRLKPQAVRNQSFEIYFLCKGYRPK